MVKPLVKAIVLSTLAFLSLGLLRTFGFEPSGEEVFPPNPRLPV